jgi:hypothetical protein
VESRQLVAYPGYHCEYICLSYTWGPGEAPRFTRGQPLPTLPRTIEDALTMCQMLQKRYLWVDSICIHQANEYEKMQQIRRMSSIYKGAFASIVSLRGSSMDSRLARVSNFSRA